jgi:hypothetical protein
MAGFSVEELGGGSSSWLPEMGDQISGTIKGIKRVQQTDFTTGEPLFWSNNDPRMQTVVELQTDLSDNSDDDGVRTVWLKGGRNYEAAQGSGTSGEVALAEAAKDAGVKVIEEGSELTIRCTGLSKPTTRGYQPAKLYKMKLVPAKASVAVEALDDWD